MNATVKPINARGSTMTLLVVSEEEVRRQAAVWRVIAANEDAFKSLESGAATVPTRLQMSFTDEGIAGMSLFKPASLRTEAIFGAKAIHVRPDNAAKGLGTTPATITLYDKASGAPVCLMNGTYLTALRTAAGSAIATRAVAPTAARRLVVFGAGLQAEAHVKAMCCVRDIDAVVIANRGEERARKLMAALAADLPGMPRDASGATLGAARAPALSFVALGDVAGLRAACEQADIVCTTTGSDGALFPASWLKPGAHVNAVGSYQPTTTELDPALPARCRVIVIDTPDALLAGDLAGSLRQGAFQRADAVTLGRLCLLAAAASSAVAVPGPGSLSAEAQQRASGDVTLFKSVGTAVQDVVSALEVYRQCLSHNAGQQVSL